LAAYSFDVLAPWWQTWWAQAIDVFVSALLLLGMHWSRQRRNRRERERLERAVAERSAELAKANKELEEASLSDPLTGVRTADFSALQSRPMPARRCGRTGIGQL